MIPIAAPSLGRAEKDRICEVIESGTLADGPEVRAFEDEFAEFCGTTHAVGTSSGTTALHATLEALDIGEGDRVLTTPFTFIATANAIRLAGAEPVFADIDPATFNLAPSAVERTVADREIDAIVAVHLYGLPAELDPLCEIANAHEIPLIEDAAQAHGATYKGRRVGSIGDAGCFSFYPTKNMTTGEGGMITTDRADVAERAARYVNHGRDGSRRYAHATVGHNFRLTSLAAAIGREQLKKLPDFVERRRANAARLTAGLAGTAVYPPTEPDHVRHAYHQYTVRTDDRDRLLAYLEERGVDAGVYYPVCVHDQPAYDSYDPVAPEAEKAASDVVSLPVHQALSREARDKIIELIVDYGT